MAWLIDCANFVHNILVPLNMSTNLKRDFNFWHWIIVMAKEKELVINQYSEPLFSSTIACPTKHGLKESSFDNTDKVNSTRLLRSKSCRFPSISWMRRVAESLLAIVGGCVKESQLQNMYRTNFVVTKALIVIRDGRLCQKCVHTWIKIVKGQLGFFVTRISIKSKSLALLASSAALSLCRRYMLSICNIKEFFRNFVQIVCISNNYDAAPTRLLITNLHVWSTCWAKW